MNIPVSFSSGRRWCTRRGCAARCRGHSLSSATATGAPRQLTASDALGVDEHVWCRTGPPITGMITATAELTRDVHAVHARLLDLAPGRYEVTYANWLKRRTPGSPPESTQPALDPFRRRERAPRRAAPSHSRFWTLSSL